jgi:hypothetical protein
LDVQCYQIQPEVQVALKQMVSQLLGEEAIEALAALCGQSANEVVQDTIVIEHERRELVLAEFQALSHVAETGEPPVNTRRFRNVNAMFVTDRLQLVGSQCLHWESLK